MKGYIKNIEHSKVLTLAGQVEYLNGQVTSKTLSQNKYNGLTLFAFDKDEQISAHDSTGDAMVTVLEGQCRITIAETEYDLKAGETIVMPAKVAHSLYAVERFKMLLVVIFPIE